jgi:hypothetical protein
MSVKSGQAQPFQDFTILYSEVEQAEPYHAAKPLWLPLSLFNKVAGHQKITAVLKVRRNRSWVSWPGRKLYLNLPRADLDRFLSEVRHRLPDGN